MRKCDIIRILPAYGFKMLYTVYTVYIYFLNIFYMGSVYIKMDQKWQ